MICEKDEYHIVKKLSFLSFTLEMRVKQVLVEDTLVLYIRKRQIVRF